MKKQLLTSILGGGGERKSKKIMTNPENLCPSLPGLDPLKNGYQFICLFAKVNLFGQ